MTVSQQGIRASVDGTPLDIIDATVTLDETVAPYAVADLTIPYREDVADLVDPRGGVRMSVILSQTFRGSHTLGDITAQIGPGAHISDLSTLYSGLTLAGVTAMYDTPWNVPNNQPTQFRILDLSVRSRNVDHRAGTIRVRATSDESLLIAYALMRSTPVMPDSYNVVDAVQLVLRTVIPGASLVVMGATGNVQPEAAIWNPGKGAWSYLEPLLSSQGLKLWCDEHRTWYLENPQTASWWMLPAYQLSIDAPGSPFAASDNGITASDLVDLDDGLWYDGCVITYRWTPWTPTGNGTPQVAYDIAGPATATKVLAVERTDTPYPGPGEAAARLAKVSRLGQVIAGSAVSDFTATPRAVFAFHSSPTDNPTGRLSAVTWTLPDGTMQIRTRDITP